MGALTVVAVGSPVEHQPLPPQTSHAYTVDVPAGAHRIVVRHSGADAVLQVSGGDLAKPLTVDVGKVRLGEEYVVVDGGSATQYEVKVSRDHGDTPASFSLAVEPVPAAEQQARSASSAATAATGSTDEIARLHESAIALWEAQGNLLEQARLHASLGHRYYTQSKNTLAAEQYAQAARVWNRAEQPAQAREATYWHGVTLARLQRLDEARSHFERLFDEASAAGDYRLAFMARNYVGLNYMGRGDFLAARQLYTELVAYLQQHGLQHQLSTAYHNLASTYYERGDPAEAKRFFNLAIATAREHDPHANVAAQLEELGGLHALQGRCERAFDYLHDALRMLRTPSPATGKIPFDKRAEGRILNRLGNCHRSLGDLASALEFYQRSLDLRIETEDERGRAYTLSNLADALRLSGRVEEALAMHAEAAKSHRTRDDKVGLVTTLAALAEDYSDLRQFKAALETVDEAIALAQQQGYTGFLARALKVKADVLAGDGHHARSLDVYAEALALHQQIQSVAGELEVRTAKAQLLSRSGQRQEATAMADEALAIAEALRAEIGSADLRARFLSVIQRLYLLRIGLLLDESGDRTALEQSLQLNDQRRARVLRERLALEPGTANAPEQDRLRDVRASLNAKLAKREQAQDRGDTAQARSLAAEISGLRIEMLELERTLSSTHEKFAEIVRAPLLDLSEVQGRLPRDAVLLDFALGADATFVWYITDDNVSAQIFAALPQTIDAADPAQAQIALGRIFADAAQRYPDRDELIVVPDGLLSLVPLASVVYADEQYLIDRFAISIAPSMAMAGAGNRLERVDSLALIGNPVYSDAQAQPGSGDIHRPVNRSMRGMNLDELPALPYSGYEIRRISEVAGARDVLLLEGYDASKARVLSEALRGRDIIHFATHGFVNPTVPELSGLVLTLVDPDGDEVDGFLSLADVYSLRGIDASLVVLSGCRTGSGMHVRGEGAMSMARAFMQSGVAHVLASQWNVPDRATAELLIDFYHGLLDEELSPARALAVAQRSIKRRPGMSHPRHWAGFSLWSSYLPPP